MKSTILRITALLLMLIMLVGCGTAGSGSSEEAPSNIEIVDPDPVPDPEPEPEPVDDGTLAADYVMIYNPQIYDETLTYQPTNLSTGSLGSQVDTSAFRADGEGLEFDFYVDSTFGIDQDDILETEPVRAEMTITPYVVGDVQDFYAFDAYEQRVKLTFTCSYAGEYCNIWTSASDMSAEQIDYYGHEFDTNIYQQEVEAFGSARFADNGGKVNLLFTPMMEGLLGLVYPCDLLYSKQDLIFPEELDEYMFNSDHAVLSINSTYASYDPYKNMMCSTMAHEFQHVICVSSALETPDWILPGTWINEAMSGYIEAQFYPGSKVESGHYHSLFNSPRLRNGQSLYNFGGDSNDIAVYGSVYLFSEYLADLAGDDVFSKFHDYWRNSYSATLCDAEAIINALPDRVISQIDASIEYPESFIFGSDEEALLSKLTLDYHLSLLNIDASSPAAYREAIETLQDAAGSLLLFDNENTLAGCFLYDKISSANIEGGGRIIVALKDGEFEIPEDADTGLVYVPLDSSFQPIGDPIFG